MKWKIAISFLLFFCARGASGNPIYKSLDEQYQKAHDPIRIKHVNEIANVIFAYDKKVGYPPLQDLVSQQQKPFMVLIGRSDIEEDRFAELEALEKGALFINSRKFEAILSQGLKQKIKLPRDPQKVATYAPNVYLYFVTQDQICVAAHLYFKSEISKPYTWSGGTFNSHAECYSKQK